MNPAPNSSAPGPGAPYPPPPYPPGYAPYRPAYPYYGYAPYPAYYAPWSWYPPQPPVLPPTPVERAASPRVGHVIRLVLGVIVALATLGSLALAGAGPLSAQLAPSPASEGYTAFYNSRLIADQGQWDAPTCAFELGGLHARELSGAASLCTFRPSESQDLVSGGFFLDVMVGRAAAVPAEQEPCIVLGNTSASPDLSLTFDQQGNYVLDTTAAERDCSLTSSTGLPVSNAFFAWHVDPEVANRISLLYRPDAAEGLILYVNGQEVTQTTWSPANGDTINVGSALGGEAVFTSFSLYNKS